MIGVDVVTVWAPRQDHAQWRDDYVKLIELQRRTAAEFGHRHFVVTDGHDFQQDVLRASLPAYVMHATIAGTVAWLSQAGRDRHIVFLDADCLVARDLGEAFEALGGGWGLGLTRREDPLAPVNNGAMYVARDAVERSRSFFSGALAACGDHWGADQEAISAAAAPVPTNECVEMRGDLAVAFLSMRTHGVVPKQKGARHYSDPFVVHFKGDTKEWAREYATRYILKEAA